MSQESMWLSTKTELPNESETASALLPIERCKEKTTPLARSLSLVARG